jgi:hypothetical protein
VGQPPLSHSLTQAGRQTARQYISETLQLALTVTRLYCDRPPALSAPPQTLCCCPCRQGPSPPRVLLPGAGLGRLCVEVAAAGFEAQGNEFSYFMLITAAFMLNATACAEQWTVHPWVHLTCNNLSDADQLRGVAVPDVVPGEVVPPGMLSMCAGDFAVRRRAVGLGPLCDSQPASWGVCGDSRHNTGFRGRPRHAAESAETAAHSHNP